MERIVEEEKLYDKVKQEYKNYCRDLLDLSAAEIIKHSFETAIKCEFVDSLVPGCDLNTLDTKSINFLLNNDNALSYLYDIYLDFEFGLDSNIKEVFNDVNKSIEKSAEVEVI